jgi:hypothetical protein
MPEYLIEIKNTNHRRTRKEKIFCEAASVAEAETAKTLDKDEYIHSISNCNFVKSHIKPLDYR